MSLSPSDLEMRNECSETWRLVPSSVMMKYSLASFAMMTAIAPACSACTACSRPSQCDGHAPAARILSPGTHARTHLLHEAALAAVHERNFAPDRIPSQQSLACVARIPQLCCHAPGRQHNRSEPRRCKCQLQPERGDNLEVVYTRGHARCHPGRENKEEDALVGPACSHKHASAVTPAMAATSLARLGRLAR